MVCERNPLFREQTRSPDFYIGSIFSVELIFFFKCHDIACENYTNKLTQQGLFLSWRWPLLIVRVENIEEGLMVFLET